MELYAQDEKIAELEARLAALKGSARLAVLVPLSWQLRQRDCARALALADEGEGLLGRIGPFAPEQARAIARFRLIRAEAKMLFADFDEAEMLALSALARFEQLGDHTGAGDCHWLLSGIQHDRGERSKVTASLENALTAYHAGGDICRIETTIARGLANEAFNDPAKAAEGLRSSFPPDGPRDPVVESWIATTRGNIAGLTDDPAAAVKFDLHAYQLGIESGQLRMATGAALNGADDFVVLGDLDAALEWSERALKMAREAGWPGMIGSSLRQTGEVLRLLGRHDEARVYLREALDLMVHYTGARNHGIVLTALGELCLDVGQFEDALEWFHRLEMVLQTPAEPDLLVKLRRGQATALSALDQPDAAWRHAQEALDVARRSGNVEEQIQTLRVCANLHREHSLPPPAEMTEPTAQLHYLRQALALTTCIKGYPVSDELLAQLATAEAAAGDFKSAYDHAFEALAARNRKTTEEAQKRALAMQIRLDIDRARADAEYHRALALYDPLTDLPNRRLMMDRLRHALSASARRGDRAALLFIDLDNFKRLNDTQGHQIGDMLLQQVGHRLRLCLRESDTVARFGGDEFVVLLERLSPDMFEATASVESVSGKILESLNEPYNLEGIEHTSTPSIGITMFSGASTTVDELLKQADVAMYRAKAEGRNAVRFYDPSLPSAMTAPQVIESAQHAVLH